MKQEDEFEKHPSLHYASLDEDFEQSLYSFFNIFSDDPHVVTLTIRLFGLPNYWSDSWRRYNLKGASSLLVFRWRPNLGRQFNLGQKNRLVAGGVYVCCLAIVVIFMELGEQRSRFSKFKRRSHKAKGGGFYVGIDPSAISTSFGVIRVL